MKPDPDITHGCVTANTCRVRRQLWWIVGLALVVGGVAIALSTPASSADVGWFAYTPSSRHSDRQIGWGDPLHDGSIVNVSRWAMAGYGLAGAGAVFLAAGIGFHIGRHRTNTSTKPSPVQQPD